MLKTKIIRLTGIAITALSIANCASTPPVKIKIDRDNPKYSTLYDVFSRYDTNSDNYLDQHEFHQFQQDPEITAYRERIPEISKSIPLLFEEIDEDGDKRISLDEITVIAEGYIPKIE